MIGLAYFGAMKYFTIVAFYCLFLIILLGACSSPCDHQFEPQSVTFRITLTSSDTMNMVATIHYPQINKTEIVNGTKLNPKYLYGFNETAVVVNYKYDTINIADTLIVKSDPKQLNFSECSKTNYYPEYGPIEIVSSSFSNIELLISEVKVTR